MHFINLWGAKPMPENQALKKSKSSLMVVILTAVTTLLVAGGGAYMLGYLGPRENGKIVEKVSANTTGQQAERKIAYWRAPMNPTEIYDQSGKSAMGMDLVPVYEDEVDSNNIGGETERKIAYWRAPMNPTEIYDKPGKSAMGMDLVPVYEDELVGGVDVKVDPVTQQNMGLRTAIVKKGPLIHTLRIYGHVTYDETRATQISPKSSGWIEKIHIDFTGKFVEKGQRPSEILSTITAMVSRIGSPIKTSGRKGFKFEEFCVSPSESVINKNPSNWLPHSKGVSHGR